MMSYPRIYVSQPVHNKVKKVSKKLNVTMKSIGDKIVRAGLKSLGY